LRLRTVLAILVAVAVCVPQAAFARRPLKPADMRTIRSDAGQRAHFFKTAYGASASRVTCRERTIYIVRCTIGLDDAATVRGRADCSVKLVYIVTGDNKIAANPGRDSCA
jgi:hypothetical protein